MEFAKEEQDQKLRVQKRFQNEYGVVVWTGENDTWTRIFLKTEQNSSVCVWKRISVDGAWVSKVLTQGKSGSFQVFLKPVPPKMHETKSSWFR